MALATATAYTDVRRATLAGGAPAIQVRRASRAKSHKAWLEQELRKGGYFDRYVQRERSKVGRQIRRVAQAFWDRRPARFRDLPKAAQEIDAELQFAIPARLYWRLRQMDPHFFDDPANLRKLKADNPELCIWK